MIPYDTGAVDTLGGKAETAINASQVNPAPETQRTNKTGHITSLNNSISRVREAAEKAQDCPWAKDKEAAAEANGVDTRGWGIGRFVWNLTEGPFAREVAELMSSLEQKVQAVINWLNESDLSTLYDGPKVLIDASLELGKAKDAAENSASHIGDNNYKATQLDAWIIADQAAYKQHRGIQGKALTQFTEFCKSGETQLGNYAMSLHVAYSAVSDILAHLAVQIAQYCQSLIDSLISKKFKDAVKDTLAFLDKALEAMQKILNQATALYTAQLNAAKDLRENTIASAFPGQKWPARPPIT